MRNRAKEKLIDAYCKFTGHKVSDTEKFLKKVTRYLEKKGNDREIELIQLMLQLHFRESRSLNVPVFRQLAEPIIEKLESINPWGMFEISIVAFVLGYTTHGKAIELAEKAVKILDENFDEDKLCKPYKRGIYFNLTYAISNAYCYDADHTTMTDPREIKDIFFHYLNIAKPLWEGEKFEAQRTAMHIRAHLISNEIKELENALAKLSEMEEPAWLSYMYDEVFSYCSYLAGRISRNTVNNVIGHQLKRRRTELKLSKADLALLLGSDVSAETITAYENASKEIIPHHIFGFTRILNVDSNYFFGSAPGETYKAGNSEQGSAEREALFDWVKYEPPTVLVHMFKAIRKAYY